MGTLLGIGLFVGPPPNGGQVEWVGMTHGINEAEVGRMRVSSSGAFDLVCITPSLCFERYSVGESVSPRHLGV